MPIGAGISAFLNSLLGLGGQASANQANRNLAKDQQKWNLEQWGRQNQYDQGIWGQQNQYNQGLWNQQNQYNEGRWNKENKFNQQQWDKQNKYNSPQAQMARYKEAGLNPHLIYGQGSSGQAGGLTAPTMRANQAESNGLKSPDVQGYSRPQMESVTRGLDAFGDYNQFKNIQAQTNNVEANTDVLEQEALLKAQDGMLKTLQLKHGGLKFNIDEKTAGHQIEMSKANVENLHQSIIKNTAEAGVATGTSKQRIQEAKIRVQTAAATLTGKKLENKLKEEASRLRKYGVNESSSTLLRMMFNWIDKNPNSFKKPPKLYR